MCLVLQPPLKILVPKHTHKHQTGDRRKGKTGMYWPEENKLLNEHTVSNIIPYTVERSFVRSKWYVL